MLVFSAFSASAQLVINEVFYNVSPQGGNQYVELMNKGTNTAFLDGTILTDEGGSGTEGVFKFPGSPGQTNHPVLPGAFVLIAVDATGATATADWECYAGPSDTDNPSVPNLTLIAGVADLGLFTGGDNVLLADGTDLSTPINSSTVIDGVNFVGGNGELAPIGPGIAETDGSISASAGFSIGRCPDGQDNNISSTSDFIVMTPSPKASNSCGIPTFSILPNSAVEGNSGISTVEVTVTRSVTTSTTSSVNFWTSNGTATAGSDYVSTNGLLVFTGTTTTQTIHIAINGDTSSEPDETFIVWLATPTNGVIVVPFATVTILNDDGSSFTSAFVRLTGTPPALTSHWTTVSGKTYQVQVSSLLMDPIWTNAGTSITASATNTSYVDTDIQTNRFYRVIQLD